ncbi:hypothetical protein STENM223S_02546 [Streptomyces tendae]
MAAELTAHELIARHRPTLDQALDAIRTRAYWSRPTPSARRRTGRTAAWTWPRARPPSTPCSAPAATWTSRARTAGWTASSPYGVELGVSYPHADLDVLLPAMRAGKRAWRDAGAETRAVVCLEILKRISDRTMEFAQAVMHTSGQAFMMAFQAGGPHAQDRGMEAVAYAYVEQVRTPDTAEWTKPQGKRDPLALTKRFVPVPRGIGLVIGCNTFPTWNGYPGLFASRGRPGGPSGRRGGGTGTAFPRGRACPRACRQQAARHRKDVGRKTASAAIVAEGEEGQSSTTAITACSRIMKPSRTFLTRRLNSVNGKATCTTTVTYVTSITRVPLAVSSPASDGQGEVLQVQRVVHGGAVLPAGALDLVHQPAVA